MDGDLHRLVDPPPVAHRLRHLHDVAQAEVGGAHAVTVADSETCVFYSPAIFAA